MAPERAELDLRVGEQRRYLRHAESTRVLFLEEAGSAPTAGSLRDISLGGVCLVAPRAIDVGTKVHLGIFLQNLPAGPLIILARVRRCSPEENSFALGLEFVHSTPTQRDALRQIRQYLVDRHGG